MIARLTDCHRWHREYLELAVERFEHQHDDCTKLVIEARMLELVALLGYVPSVTLN